MTIPTPSWGGGGGRTWAPQVVVGRHGTPQVVVVWMMLHNKDYVPFDSHTVLLWHDLNVHNQPIACGP